MNKITCVCLGVRDMARSVAFYRDGLGFKTDCVEDSPRVCFFDTPGTKFELYPLDLLAEEVDDVVELVRAVGGAIVKEPQEVFWGGYHAYFADPDGYYWEVAWGPDFRYDEDGMLVF